MIENMKPCPFCGTNPIINRVDYDLYDQAVVYGVECPNCKAYANASVWNKRTATEAPTKRHVDGVLIDMPKIGDKYWTIDDGLNWEDDDQDNRLFEQGECFISMDAADWHAARRIVIQKCRAMQGFSMHPGDFWLNGSVHFSGIGQVEAAAKDLGESIKYLSEWKE